MRGVAGGCDEYLVCRAVAHELEWARCRTACRVEQQRREVGMLRATKF